MRIAVPILLAAACAAAGCVNLGPRALEAGHADSNQVLRDTADQQLLARLFALQAGGGDGLRPVLTLPVGG